MKPYIEKKIKKNQYLRIFDSKTSQDEFEWHLDKEDRVVEVMENRGNWYIQFDNKLPTLLNKTIFIPKETYHRVIKGNDILILKIEKLN